MKNVYMDYSATTPVKKEVLDAMLPYFSEHFGNPSSLYSIAQKSKEALEKAREQVASLIGAKANEVFFTAGGSEADNWALEGVADALKDKGNHIITTKILMWMLKEELILRMWKKLSQIKLYLYRL